MSNNRVYFPNLDGIRFFAALMVIVHHIEQLRSGFGLKNNWDNEIIRSLGMLGVILFFVLSGFLISYLFFKEQDHTNSIDIKKFYVRRILRIWPLYFFLVLISLFILPYLPFMQYPGAAQLDLETKFFKVLPLYIIFLPNLVMVAINTIPFCSQTWSIGVEEQFYLIWPLLNKYFKSKILISVMVIIVYLIIKYSLLLKIIGNGQNSLLYQFWESMPIHFMAIGSIFAYLSFFETKLAQTLKRILYNKFTQLITVIIIISLLAFNFKVMYINLEVYAVLFGIIILNAASGTQNIFLFNNALLRYLGKISYGLYMYHFICIVCVIKILMKLGYESNMPLLYFTVVASTILISGISYSTLENYFLKYKIKYSIIPSGDTSK